MENSNAIQHLNYEYDVYHSYGRCLSLRTFPHSLHSVMNQKGLTYNHNNEYYMSIRRNDNIPISPPRLKAMQESRIFIVSIGANYASSVFCLNELVEILNCIKFRNNQLLCPVFVNLDPSDLRYLRNRVGEAMAQHEHRFGRNSEEVKKWKTALFELSNLTGWHIQTQGLEESYKFAEKVASWITRSLNRYDIFLSFSESDTRYSFTGYLYNALHRDGFKTFMEDEGWVNAEKNSKFHIQAIEESKFSVIIFSKNYAHSTCHLDALIKILECHKLKKQRVLFPIFYKVQPSDVRHQRNYYHEAMTIHENRFGKESEKVQKWKAALSEVASFKGWSFENGYVHETIQEIVGLVNKNLPRYDVFLSFRGEDIRHTFTSYLYYALCKKGFKTFMDDQGLERGNQISQALNYAIQESKFSIIVFSENYAYSSWCLNELVNILERKRMQNHRIWPIYYKVKPFDVWHQRNSYGKAMEKHENRFGKGSNEVQKWRLALSEVANLENWQFENGYEHKFIEQIVESIVSKVQGATQRNTHVL